MAPCARLHCALSVRRAPSPARRRRRPRNSYNNNNNNNNNYYNYDCRRRRRGEGGALAALLSVERRQPRPESAPLESRPAQLKSPPPERRQRTMAQHLAAAAAEPLSII